MICVYFEIYRLLINSLVLMIGNTLTLPFYTNTIVQVGGASSGWSYNNGDLSNYCPL